MMRRSEANLAHLQARIAVALCQARQEVRKVAIQRKNEKSANAAYDQLILPNAYLNLSNECVTHVGGPLVGS